MTGINRRGRLTWAVSGISTLVLLATTACGGASGGASGAEGMEIKWAWAFGDNFPTGKQTADAVKTLEADESVQVDISAYPGGSLFNNDELQDAVRNHSVDIATTSLHRWSSYEPSLNIDQLPYAFDGLDGVRAAEHGKFGEHVDQLLRKHGITVVGWTLYGYVGDICNSEHPVQSAADLKGLRMRAPGAIYAALLEHYGGQPVELDSSEAVTAIQRGQISGGITGATLCVKDGWVDAGTKYITALQFAIALYPVVANLDWWNGLTEEQQKAISDAVAAHEDENAKAIGEAQQDALETATKGGAEVSEPDGDALEAWQKDLAFLNDVYIKETGDVGKQLLAEAQQAA